MCDRVDETRLSSVKGFRVNGSIAGFHLADRERRVRVNGLGSTVDLLRDRVDESNLDGCDSAVDDTVIAVELLRGGARRNAVCCVCLGFRV